MAWGRDCPCAWDCWSLATLLCLPLGKDAVGVDEDAAAADPGHATRIGSPLRKWGNRRPGAEEGLPLCLGSLVATLMGPPRGGGPCRG